MLKFKKLAAILLTAATIAGSTISVNTVQAFAANKQQQVQNNVSITAIQDKENGMKFVANTKFVNDPNDDKLTLLLSVDGSFINSGLKKSNVKRAVYDHAEMIWPSSYECSIKTIDNDLKEKTQIVATNRTNIIAKSQISNNSGYSLGKDSSGINAGYNESTSVTYEQPNYQTIQNVNDIDHVLWKIDFNSTSDNYTRSSYNPVYGNQMFMKSRYSNYGKNNLTDDANLSTLITGGYSPKFSVVVKAPKNKKETIVEVTFKKQLDKYKLEWYKGANWVGSNSTDKTINVTKRFVVNWKKHTVKSEEEVEKEAVRKAKRAKEEEKKEIKLIIEKLNKLEESSVSKAIFKETLTDYNLRIQEENDLKEKADKLQTQGKIVKRFIEGTRKVTYSSNNIMGGISGTIGHYQWEYVNN